MYTSSLSTPWGSLESFFMCSQVDDSKWHIHAHHPVVSEEEPKTLQDLAASEVDDSK